MLESYATYVGGTAAFLASHSYIPQVRKAWPRGSTKDLSLSMLTVLTLGLSLWLVYGMLRGDGVIIIANAVGAPRYAASCSAANCATSSPRVAISQSGKMNRATRAIALLLMPS